MLRAEERRLWAVVAATIRPTAGRAPSPATLRQEEAAADTASSPPAQLVHRPGSRTSSPAERKPTPALRVEPQPIEPGRRRRIGRGRDPIEGRLDLHGLDQDRARQALHDFLLHAQARGARAVLVITGKGTGGAGVLRRRTPEWLSDPRMRDVVAGIAAAEPHHGGDGAIYVAVKRRPQ